MKIKALLACLMLLFVVNSNLQAQKNKQPNIIFIMADDLGYGDVSANESGTLRTPEIDKMAKEGLRFTRGYCTSATCTPSRYGLLTGQYPWRNKRAAILAGDAPLLIDPKMETLPKMLQKAGYKTAVIGKWHLGMGDGKVDWNKEIELTPNAVGFEYSYVMAATNDRTPTVYVENHKVVGLDPADPLYVSYKHNFPGEPTATSHPELVNMKWAHGHCHSVLNGIGRIGYQKGGKSAMWYDQDMSDHFLNKTIKYLEENKDKPFFLYYALHQPHVPRVPHPRFVGKSGMGPRGDAILEADWCVGQVLNKLRELNIDENTLVIFSSDNGPVLNDGYHDEAREKIGKHTPWGPYRGGKYSLLNAGTNVPFITWWPGEIEAGKTSNTLVSQLDIMASVAAHTKIKANTHDSENHWKTLLGKSNKGRTQYVLEAGRKLALLSDGYAYIPPYKGKAINQVNNETGLSTQEQVYNMDTDPGQTTNLAQSNPELLAKLSAQYKALTKK